MKSLLWMAVGLMLGTSLLSSGLAIAENSVTCTVNCSRKLPNGQSIGKTLSCDYPIPPGMSFSAADCQKECTERCANSLYGASAGKVIKPLRKK